MSRRHVTDAPPVTASLEPESGTCRVANVVDMTARRTAQIESDGSPSRPFVRAEQIAQDAIGDFLVKPTNEKHRVAVAAVEEAWAALDYFREHSFVYPSKAAQLIRTREESLIMFEKTIRMHASISGTTAEPCAPVVSLTAERLRRGIPIAVDTSLTDPQARALAWYAIPERGAWLHWLYLCEGWDGRTTRALERRGLIKPWKSSSAYREWALTPRGWLVYEARFAKGHHPAWVPPERR